MVKNKTEQKNKTPPSAMFQILVGGGSGGGGGGRGSIHLSDKATAFPKTGSQVCTPHR